MRLHFVLVSSVVLSMGLVAGAQTRRPAAKPAPTPPKKEAASVSCPTPLGVGASTKRTFCDVLIGREPSNGILVTLPPHRGPVTLTFDLHNRHTFSQEQLNDKRTAFSRYTASIGTLTLDNTLLRRAAVQSEFRSPDDFFDRITGGAGPSGLKAVAPLGTESVTVTIPESETSVSILGENLLTERADGAIKSTSPGSPIAIVSNLMVEYQPPPPPRPAAKAPAAKAPASKAPATRPK
ncbi:MAG: hypothetical protein LBQ09_01720 [Acidobacteriaceae bacterium]|jgi:hypothetical protein|nr:hypothetical protein [Acidobacteriaceae bacterium]